MTSRILAVALLLGTANAAENTYYTYVQGLASGVGETFAVVAEGSTDAWDKLATPQAKRVLRDLASNAETLYARNKILEREADEHMRDNTANTFSIDSEIQKMRTQALTMAHQLEKFRREVDQAVGAETHKRGNTEVAMDSKAAILADVDVSWRTGHYNEAVISLEEGLEQLQRAQNGIACLQKSIEQKETECDKNTLAPLKERKP